MKVNEIFESIQGEGKYVGHPVLFIRLSGCTRECDFCDTKYHVNGEEISVKKIAERINKSKLETIVWTGGEPMLQQNEIYSVMSETLEKNHQLETNGDITPKLPTFFNYIAFSPKEEKVHKKIIDFCDNLNPAYLNWDIKIVTDLKLNKEMIEGATMLMPLSTYDKKKDLKIQQDVWNYCVKNNIKYCHRIHVDVWGQKIGK